MMRARCRPCAKPPLWGASPILAILAGVMFHGIFLGACAVAGDATGAYQVLHTSNQEGQHREQIEQQGLSSAPSPMNQHTEVAQLLRDLVRSSGEPGCDPESDIGEEHGSHAKAAQKVMQAISNQDQVRERLLAVRRGPMAMVPM